MKRKISPQLERRNSLRRRVTVAVGFALLAHTAFAFALNTAVKPLARVAAAEPACVVASLGAAGHQIVLLPTVTVHGQRG